MLYACLTGKDVALLLSEHHIAVMLLHDAKLCHCPQVPNPTSTSRTLCGMTCQHLSAHQQTQACVAAWGPAVCLCAAQASLAPVAADNHSGSSPGAQHVGAAPPQPASPVHVPGEPPAMGPPQPLGVTVTTTGAPGADAAAANLEEELGGADVADDAAAAAEEEAEDVPVALTPIMQGLLHRTVAAGTHTRSSSVFGCRLLTCVLQRIDASCLVSCLCHALHAAFTCLQLQPLGGNLTTAGDSGADAAAASVEEEVGGADVADDAAAAVEEEVEAVPAALTPIVQGLLHRTVAAGMHTLGSSV